MSDFTDAVDRLANFYNDGVYDIVDNPGGFDGNGHRQNFLDALRDIAIVGEGLAVNDAMIYKGATDCSSNPNYPAAERGDTYRVSVAGKIGGASGVAVEAGDFFICNTDGTASGDQATVGSSWNVIQTNLGSFGTGVAAALAVNVGTDGAVVVKGGALGSPSSAGTMPAFTLGGTVSGDNQQLNNVVIGTSSPRAGSFTTLSATGDVSINSAGGAIFYLNKATAADYNILAGQKAGSARWSLILGDGTNETGSNAGSNFQLTNYSDAGAYLSAAVTIYRATGGVVVGAAGGGDKGAGTINAVAVYDDNVLLTCYVLQAFMEGGINTAYWDALVVNRVTDQQIRTREVTERKSVYHVDLVLSADGSHYVAQKSVREIDSPVKVWIPIYDDKGNGIGAREEVVTETYTIPASEEVRNHEPARAFADRLDELDPDVFVAKWKRTGVLPGFPSPEEFAARPPSTGEMIQKLWELCELQAVHIAVLSDRIAAK